MEVGRDGVGYYNHSLIVGPFNLEVVDEVTRRTLTCRNDETGEGLIADALISIVRRQAEDTTGIVDIVYQLI